MRVQVIPTSKLPLLAAALLVLSAFALGTVAASPPYNDCDYGVTLGGSFTGYCGTLDGCGAVVVGNRVEAILYGQC